MNYFITVLFLLVSSSANYLGLDDKAWFAIMLLMFAYVLAKKLLVKSDLRILGLFLLVYLVFVAARNFIVTNLPFDYLLSDIIFPFKYVLFSFIYVVILREKVLDYVVKVMVHFTLISLFFYTLQLVGFGETIYNASQSLGIPNTIGIPGYTNFIIFTFTLGRHDYRNSGFVWEPGAFGCFLIIALLFNFLRNKFTFDKKAIILTIGLITTLSTTDYLAYIVLLFLLYRYRVPKMNLWILILIPAFVITIIVVPFLGQKIAEIYTDDIKGLEALKHYHADHVKHAEQIPLNRFASLIYLWDTLGSGLILGESNKYDAIINTNYTLNISNGIFDFFAKFGMVGFIYLIYCYAKFCWAFLKRGELIIYCILILSLIGFGEPILFLPITLLFLFLPFLTKIEGIDNRKQDNQELA